MRSNSSKLKDAIRLELANSAEPSADSVTENVLLGNPDLVNGWIREKLAMLVRLALIGSMEPYGKIHYGIRVQRYCEICAANSFMDKFAKEASE
jgi:hypothetical protein